MKKLFFIVVVMICAGITLNAQNKACKHDHVHFHTCYMDEMVSKNIQQNPSVLDDYIIHEENLRQIIKTLRENPQALANVTKTDTLIDGKRIIPVVFHVIHKGGEENISAEQIHDAIEKMNLDYNLMNADTADTYPLFKSRAADCQIEFRLARIDPEGNCTDGIHRVYDPATEYAQFNVMSENSWPYSMYMNVYSVSFIYPEGMTLPEGAFIGGLSPFTPDNLLSGTGGDTLLDGVLIRHDCIGTIGTATNFAGMGINNQGRVLTHESGHFFDLYHPFQNLMATILGMDNCTMMPMLGINGDEVDDTPPVFEATQGCPTLDQNTCTTDSPDEPDMVQNFMDYAFGWCQTLFTQGQLERINATLASTRRNLWSYENLVATGVLDTAEQLCAPIADFYYDTYMVCEGDSVSFIDWSYNGSPDGWQWDFEGGTPAVSFEQNPVITYNTAGVYSVTLTSSNASGDGAITKTAIINVYDTDILDPLPLMEGFETPGTTDDWVFYNEDGNSWVESDTAAFEGDRCIRIQNYTGNARFSYDEFITPAYDLTQIHPDVPPKLRFKMAYAGRRDIVSNPLFGTTDTTDIYDALQVYVSKDCGKSWHLKFNKIGANLPTVGLREDPFAPVDETEWRQESISLLAYDDETNVRFKFRFLNSGGNNIYIDNINIESISADINELDRYNVVLKPNPMNTASILSFDIENDVDVSIIIFDVLGKEIVLEYDQRLGSGTHNYKIDKERLHGDGIYIIKMMIGESVVTKKLICN